MIRTGHKLDLVQTIVFLIFKMIPFFLNCCDRGKAQSHVCSLYYLLLISIKNQE